MQLLITAILMVPFSRGGKGKGRNLLQKNYTTESEICIKSCAQALNIFIFLQLLQEKLWASNFAVSLGLIQASQPWLITKSPSFDEWRSTLRAGGLCSLNLPGKPLRAPQTWLALKHLLILNKNLKKYRKKAKKKPNPKTKTNHPSPTTLENKSSLSSHNLHFYWF